VISGWEVVRKVRGRVSRSRPMAPSTGVRMLNLPWKSQRSSPKQRITLKARGRSFSSAMLAAIARETGQISKKARKEARALIKPLTRITRGRKKDLERWVAKITVDKA